MSNNRTNHVFWPVFWVSTGLYGVTHLTPFLFMGEWAGVMFEGSLFPWLQLCCLVGELSGMMLVALYVAACMIFGVWVASCCVLSQRMLARKSSHSNLFRVCFVGAGFGYMVHLLLPFGIPLSLEGFAAGNAVDCWDLRSFPLGGLFRPLQVHEVILVSIVESVIFAALVGGIGGVLFRGRARGCATHAE
jgi:hypothetical protein